MKKCPNCGSEAPNKNGFCKICGARLTEPYAAQLVHKTSARKKALKKICPSCGSENQPNANFCANCGQRLVIEDETLESPVQASTDSSVASSMNLAGSVKEAFVTLVRATPPIARPSEAVYKKLQPYSSIGKYLIVGLLLFFIGMILSTSGLFLSAPLWFIAVVSISPLLYILWIYRQDRLEREPHELVILSLGWGAFSAFLVELLWRTILADMNIPSWISGPLPEEPLKILGIYWLATNKSINREFNDHLDGMVYGAAAGAGFAIAENFLYVLYMFVEGVPLLLAVLVRSTIGHVFYSALVGRWLGLAKARRGYVKAVDLIPGLTVAMVLHGLWNSPLFDPILSLFNYAGGDYGFVIGLFFISIPYYSILYKYFKEAKRDEKLWGYSIGDAPTEN